MLCTTGGSPTKWAKQYKLLMPIFGVCFLSGCGLHTPDVQEFWGTPAHAQFMVDQIVREVKCELRNALQDVKADDMENSGGKNTAFLNNWVAQVSLTLTIDETTALNPGLSLNTPIHNGNVNFVGEALAPSATRFSFLSVPQSYALGLGGNFSADANRIDIISGLWQVPDLFQWNPPDRACPNKPFPNDILYVQSDLKLRDWLYMSLMPEATDRLTFPDKVDPSFTPKSVLSHEVKFQIITSGNITPTWKMVRVSANTGNSPLFGSGRTRTHDLPITLGPKANPKDKSTYAAPDTLSQQQHAAQLIGQAVANNLRSLLTQP